jgi:hypothetical protein
MSERQFPAALRGLRNFLLWKKVGNSFQLGHFEDGNWIFNRSYLGRPKHTLAEIMPALNGNPEYHAAFCLEGTGVAVVDFDCKKFAELEALHPDKAEQIEANRATMDAWRAQFATYTFVEQSKTAGCYHALIVFPHARRAIGADADGNEVKLPLDLLGAGLVVLTGDAQNVDPVTGEIVAFDIQKPQSDDTAMIERYWDMTSGDPAPMGQRWFGQGDRRRLVTVNAPAVYSHESVDLVDVRDRVASFGPKYDWFVNGEGDCPLMAGVHNHVPRMDLLQATAAVCYGMPNAAELIWEVVSTSHFATDYTPANSNSNKDRFRNRAQVGWIRNEEIPLAIALAHEKAISDKAEADEFRPQVERLLAAAEAREERFSEGREIKPRTNMTSKLELRSSMFLFRLIERAFNETLSVADIAEAENTLPFWRSLTTIAFNGLCAAMTVRPSGAGCAPCMFVLARTGEGKALLPTFIRSVLGDFDDYPDALEVYSGFTGGAAIRDKVVQGKMILATVQEGKETLIKIASPASSNGADNSYQSYLPDTMAGMATAQHGRANSSKQHEGGHVQDPLLSYLMFIQPQFVEEAVNDPRVSVYGLATGGIFGRAPGFVAPQRGAHDPALFCAEPRFYHPTVMFLRQIVVAASQMIEKRKAFSFKHTNNRMFWAWLREDMVTLGPLEEVANRFAQLCWVYALQHAFARCITRGHYKTFMTEYLRRRKMQEFSKLRPRSERQGIAGDMMPQMISFDPDHANKAGLIYIALPTVVENEDYEFGRDICRLHASFLMSLFAGQLSGTMPADAQRIAILKKLQSCMENASKDTFTPRDIQRAKGLGQGHVQKIGNGPIVKLLDELVEKKVIERGARKGTYRFDGKAEDAVDALLEQMCSEGAK